MVYEHLLKQADGSTIKAIVNFHDNSYTNGHSYRVELWKADKGKRKFYRPYDEDSYTHRALSMEDRRKVVKQWVIDIVGEDDYNHLLIEAWNKLKPELL